MYNPSAGDLSNLCAGETDTSSWDLEVEARLGVLLSPQSRVITPLLAIQPVNTHISDGQQDTGE